MSTMLVCTVGDRDVLLDGNILEPARVEGARVLAEFESHRKQLSFPIITPTLNYVLERHNVIDRLILVATDQTQAEERFRAKDTIEFARLIQRHLTQNYGQKKISDIRIERIPERPNLLDEMYEFFGETIARNKAFQLEGLYTLYVQPTGGVPSANMALLFQCINTFGVRCRPLYVSEHTASVVPLQIGQQVLEKYRRENLLILIENYDYLSLTKELNPSDTREKCLWRLAKYAEALLSFDIDGANFHATEGMGESLGQDRILSEVLLFDIKELWEKRNLEARIRELFWNMQVKQDRGEYVDLLGRLYRFQEAVLRYIVEKDLCIHTDLDPKTRKNVAFQQGIQDNPQLETFLKLQKAPDGQELDYTKVDLPVLMACLHFLTQDTPSYVEVYSLFQNFEPLTRLRNRSIIGHGFEGVSEDIFREAYKGELLEDIRTLLERMGLDITEGPFVQLNFELRKRINKL